MPRRCFEDSDEIRKRRVVGKDGVDELKEGIWIEPAKAVLKRKCSRVSW